jgi:hypothetical protein
MFHMGATMTTLDVSLREEKAPGKNPISAALDLIREHKRAYLITNAVYYGVIVVGMIVILFNRPLQKELYDAIGQAFGEGGMFGVVLESYEGGDVLKAIGITFGINFVLGSFAELTLPSLIIPFIGWLVGLYRALLWGFLFAPTLPVEFSGQNILTGALLTGLLFLEGQGYVLAMFGVYLQGRAALYYKKAGAETFWKGYLLGLKQTVLIYLLVAIVLVIAAIYEVTIYGILAR